jgi:hypothetical protein
VESQPAEERSAQKGSSSKKIESRNSEIKQKVFSIDASKNIFSSSPCLKDQTMI